MKLKMTAVRQGETDNFMQDATFDIEGFILLGCRTRTF